MKLTIKQWQKYHQDLANNFWPTINKGLKIGAKRALTVVRTGVEQAPPASPRGSIGAVYTGNYKRTWKTELIEHGIRIYNSAPYAGTIEYGRRAGKTAPPSKALEPWVRRKLGVSAAQAKGIAYVVARAIARRGLKARKVLANSNENIAKAIEAEIEFELDKVLKTGHG